MGFLLKQCSNVIYSQFWNECQILFFEHLIAEQQFTYEVDWHGCEFFEGRSTAYANSLRVLYNNTKFCMTKQIYVLYDNRIKINNLLFFNFFMGVYFQMNTTAHLIK